MNNASAYKILIADDEIEYQNVVSFVLKNTGYSVATCSNGKEALDYIMKNETDLVITDLKMPVMDGIELIEKAKNIYEDLDIIVITAFGSIESAINSIKIGAADYFVKTGDLDELVMKVNRLAKLNRLEKKSSILIRNQYSEEAFLDSKNKEYIELLEMCRRTADTGINILLLGESGVGKEIIANYIHQLSNRMQEPFVPVNCQVFPEGVIESELFGHEKGSFTGAIDKRIGRFEEADFGTLFLDEICDLPITTQGKLLRTLETRKIERVGSNKQLSLEVRFISATNKAPENEIRAGRFREDLLYRINTLTLTIPPLRNRREDIPGLIDFFVERIEAEQKKKITKIDDEVIYFLLEYDYPGNVRELKNIIERMIALSRNGHITLAEMLMPVNAKINDGKLKITSNIGLRNARADFEERYITEALKNASGNVTKAARNLQITTRQLWNKINQYGIDREDIVKRE
ncbi:MAG: sigma-54-dependent Fis family transcriptional regulator [Clostridiales bacterium]|nr:sigma-54-dependent Fis family transcriptional regulator [Clostridiales bacterium]